jgi:hypothetical protein
MRQSQGVKHRCRQRGVEVLIAGHDHGVCFAENLEPSRCGNGDAGPDSPCHPTFRAHRHVVVRVATEDLRRDPELQWDQAGEPEHGHPMRALGRHGLIIAVNGPRATVDLLAMSIRLRP